MPTFTEKLVISRTLEGYITPGASSYPFIHQDRQQSSSNIFLGGILPKGGHLAPRYSKSWTFIINLCSHISQYVQYIIAYSIKTFIMQGMPQSEVGCLGLMSKYEKIY